MSQATSTVIEEQRQAITNKIRSLVPDATAIIFFGSRVRGLPSPESDYDVMVMTPRGVDLDERKRIKGILERSFPDMTLDLAFGSERWLRANLGREAHFRFWLENGIATYGRIPRVRPYPTLYRDVVGTELDFINARLLLVEGWSRTQYYEARGYLRLFKHLTLIEFALKEDYSNDALWAEITETVGAELLKILRDKNLRHRIRKPMVERMRGLVRRKLSKIRRRLATSDLPFLLSPKEPTR